MNEHLLTDLKLNVLSIISGSLTIGAYHKFSMNNFTIWLVVVVDTP